MRCGYPYCGGNSPECRTCLGHPFMPEVAPQTPLGSTELLNNLREAARTLLADGKTKEGLAVQSCITMLEDDSPIPDYPLMRAGFCTSVSNGTEKMYQIRFSFPSLDAMVGAYSEWANR